MARHRHQEFIRFLNALERAIPQDKAVHAIVVLEDGRTATPEELEAHARESIAGYKVPKSIEIRSEPLPLSGAMKVLKRELREPYWAGHERGVN